MKNLAKVFCLLFVSQLSFGQQDGLRELKPNYTVPIKKEIKKEPLIYSVHEVSFEKTIKEESMPILNKEYVFLERNIKILEKDSIYYHSKLETATKRQNDLWEIRTLINDFVNSSEKFENKKEKLISAQKLSDKHDLKELIYADDTINTEKSADFFVLQLDEQFLNAHLKRVNWHIKDLFVALPITNANIVNKKLQSFRLAIKGTEKYKYRTDVSKNLIRDGLVVNTEFDSSEFFKDDFEQLGPHFIIYNGYKDKFQEGELIDQNTAIKNNLIGDSHSGGSWELFKQKNTGKLFLVDFNFVDEYSFFEDGKFNMEKLSSEYYKESSVVMSE